MRVAACCRGIVRHGNPLQPTATQCSTLPLSTLQHITTPCNTPHTFTLILTLTDIDTETGTDIDADADADTDTDTQ